MSRIERITRFPICAAALATLSLSSGLARADDPPGPDYERRIKIERRRIVLGERIYFEHGRGRILPVSFPILDALAARLRANPAIERLQVEGHTNTVGPREVNQRLSAFRARAVRDYLVQKGVPEGRLVARGFGADWPIASNLTEGGRERNRRVEFVILEVLKRHVWRRRAATQDFAVAIRSSPGTEERGPEGATKALASNQPLFVGDTVETPDGAGATLRLPGIVLATLHPRGALRLESIRGSSEGEGRAAMLRLIRGSAWMRAYRPLVDGGARISVEVGGARLRFEHAELRVAREAGGARIEVLGGKVALLVGDEPLELGPGEGARVDTIASTVSRRKLPASPGGRSPERGEIEAPTLSWAKVAGATQYVVEVARDVDFLDLVARQETEHTQLAVGLSPGSYYWRVRARDAEGFEGAPWPLLKFERK